MKTLAAPYSVRGIAGASVAMLLEWQELAHASPLDYTMKTVPAIVRKRGDIWARFPKQDIAAVLRRGLWSKRRKACGS